MGVSKVDFGNETLIDLTNDTVNENNLLAGATAHGANGEPITGSVVTHEYTAGDGIDITNSVISTETRLIDITQAEYDALPQAEKMNPSIYYNLTDSNIVSAEVVDALNSSDATKALSANQGRILNKKNEILSTTVNQNWQGNGYNLIPFPYYSGKSKSVNGITYIVNEDGSVTVDGTATANCDFFLRTRTAENWIVGSGKYMLTGCPEGGGANTYRISLGRTLDGAYSSIGNDFGNGFNFNPDSQYDHVQISVFITNGATVSNLTFYPMLVKVNDDGTYPTEYQRYAMGNVELSNEVNELVLDTEKANGYNLIPFPYYESSKTFKGITYTVNHDGTINASGTASGGASGLSLTYSTKPLTLKAGTYHLSGCPNGGTLEGSYHYRIRIGKGSSNTYVGSTSEEYGYTLNVISEDIYIFTIQVYNGETVNLTFRPMLVEVRPDGTYPTEYKKYGSDTDHTIEGISGGDDWLPTQAYSVNNYVIYQNKLYRCKANTTAGIAPTNTTYWEPISIKELNTNLVAENGQHFRYGFQDGKDGRWIKEADTDVFVPFKNGIGNFSYLSASDGRFSPITLEVGKDYLLAYTANTSTAVFTFTNCTYEDLVPKQTLSGVCLGVVKITPTSTQVNVTGAIRSIIAWAEM